MSAREDVRRTLEAYPFYVDTGKHQQVAELFLPEGVFDTPQAGEVTGRDAIAAFLRGMADVPFPPGTLRLLRHHITSQQLELEVDSQARAHSYFLAVSDRGMDHWGTYRDQLVEVEPGSWKFVRRRFRIDGCSPGSWWAHISTSLEEEGGTA